MESNSIKVLVTGSNGQLGSEIKAISDQFPLLDLFYTDVNELDITNPIAVNSFINKFKPKFLVNCAAYTAVDKAEKEIEISTAINSIAPGILSMACRNYGCKMIHISTDYVFDGESNASYSEKSQVNPTSQYGISKLKGEEAVIREGGAMIIRTSWLYSSFGANFVKTIIKNAKIKSELKVVSDQIGCPTYARDLAKVILSIISKGEDRFIPEIFHYSNEGTCSWSNFASEIVELSGLNCIVTPIESKDYPSPVKRPKYSVFSKEKICSTYNFTIPHWKTSLGNCIEILKLDGLI